MTTFSYGEAVLDTSVDTSGLDKGVEDSKKKADTGFASIGSSAGALLASGIAAGAAAAGAAIVAVGVASFNVAQDIDQSSRDIETGLGVSKEAADGLADSVAGIYANNFGKSIEDVTDSLITVNQQFERLGELSTTALEDATTNALMLRDVFDKDVGESTNAAATLMDEFGLSQEEAFDFITYGLQNGLDASDDFLDSIGEYSNQFADAGFDANQFFSLMETGMAGGVLGTDKAADAFKEFRIIWMEQSDDLLDSLDMIGVDSGALWQGMQDGTMTAADAFAEIMPAVMAMESPLERNSMLTKLFGTAAEDLGPTFFESLDLASTSLDDMAGSTDGLTAKYGTLGDAAEGFKRRFLVAIEPIGEVLLNLINEIMPTVEAGFSWFETNLVPQIEAAAASVTSFVATFKNLQAGGVGAFDALRGAIDSAFGTEALLQFDQINESFASLRDTWVEGVERISTHLDPLRQLMSDMGVETEGWGITFGDVVAGIVSFIEDHLAVAFGAIELAFQSVNTAYTAFFLPIITGVQEFANWLSTAVFGFNFEWPELPYWAESNSPMVLHTSMENFKSWADSNPIEPQIGSNLPNGIVGELETATGQAADGAQANGGAVFGDFRIENLVIEGEVTQEQANRTAGRLHDAMRARGLVTG